MKFQRLFLMFPFLFTSGGCSPSIPYEPKKLDPNVTYEDVYLLMGQSNCSGVSEHRFLKEKYPELYNLYEIGNDKVLISYDTYARIDDTFKPVHFGCADADIYFGPEIGISEVLKEKETTSYIIKASLSGSCLQTQYVDKYGNKYFLYNRFVDFIKKQIHILEEEGKNPRIRGVFWMQGESDAFGREAISYKYAEQYFLEYLRSDLNEWIYEYFNFVDAFISTKSVYWENADTLNKSKETVSKNNDHAYVIKTNGEDENAIDLSLKALVGEEEDYAHYDSKSMLLLGLEAGKYLIK